MTIYSRSSTSTTRLSASDGEAGPSHFLLVLGRRFFAAVRPGFLWKPKIGTMNKNDITDSVCESVEEVIPPPLWTSSPVFTMADYGVVAAGDREMTKETDEIEEGNVKPSSQVASDGEDRLLEIPERPTRGTRSRSPSGTGLGPRPSVDFDSAEAAKPPKEVTPPPTPKKRYVVPQYMLDIAAGRMKKPDEVGKTGSVTESTSTIGSSADGVGPGSGSDKTKSVSPYSAFVGSMDFLSDIDVVTLETWSQRLTKLWTYAQFRQAYEELLAASPVDPTRLLPVNYDYAIAHAKAPDDKLETASIRSTASDHFDDLQARDKQRREDPIGYERGLELDDSDDGGHFTQTAFKEDTPYPSDAENSDSDDDSDCEMDDWVVMPESEDEDDSATIRKAIRKAKRSDREEIEVKPDVQPGREWSFSDIFSRSFRAHAGSWVVYSSDTLLWEAYNAIGRLSPLKPGEEPCPPSEAGEAEQAEGESEDKVEENVEGNRDGTTDKVATAISAQALRAFTFPTTDTAHVIATIFDRIGLYILDTPIPGVSVSDEEDAAKVAAARAKVLQDVIFRILNRTPADLSPPGATPALPPQTEEEQIASQHLALLELFRYIQKMDNAAAAHTFRTTIINFCPDPAREGQTGKVVAAEWVPFLRALDLLSHVPGLIGGGGDGVWRGQGDGDGKEKGDLARQTFPTVKWEQLFGQNPIDSKTGEPLPPVALELALLQTAFHILALTAEGKKSQTAKAARWLFSFIALFPHTRLELVKALAVVAIRLDEVAGGKSTPGFKHRWSVAFRNVLAAVFETYPEQTSRADMTEFLRDLFVDLHDLQESFPTDLEAHTWAILPNSKRKALQATWRERVHGQPKETTTSSPTPADTPASPPPLFLGILEMSHTEHVKQLVAFNTIQTARYHRRARHRLETNPTQTPPGIMKESVQLTLMGTKKEDSLSITHRETEPASLPNQGTTPMAGESGEIELRE